MKTQTQKKLKNRKNSLAKSALASIAAASAMALLTYDARGNVYATDILVNSNFPPIGSVSVGLSAPVYISYHLNQAATLGVTVYIMQGNTIVATIPGGTAQGLNQVSWTPSIAGTYSISIMAGASDVSGGTGSWTQISVDGTNTSMAYPLGIDVDKNTNSPYYGRVVVGNAIDGAAHGVTNKVGLYKANADTTPADEGGFGYGNYTTNDWGSVGVGEMSSAGESYHNYQLPLLVRIGSDDRIYFMDTSEVGAVVATDMQATTNQIVITEGPGGGGNISASGGYPTSPNNYSQIPGPFNGELNAAYGPGFGRFDVAGFESGHPAVYLFDYQDYPNPGCWMFHMTNGASDPADTIGTQVINPDSSTLFYPAGFSVDSKLDLFVGQDRSGATDVANRVLEYTNWNGGVLPAEASGTTYAVNGANYEWALGSALAQFTGVNDVAINSRTAPTMIAVGMINGSSGGIQVLKTPEVTPTITGVTAVPTGTLGASTVSIQFATSGSPLPYTFSVYGATNVNASFTPLAAAITGASGSYQAVMTNSPATMFYKIFAPAFMDAAYVDPANYYTAVAFDNVGNVYGCSDTTNYWRAWSPPGANTNTTVATETIIVTP